MPDRIDSSAVAGWLLSISEEEFAQLREAFLRALTDEQLRETLRSIRGEAERRGLIGRRAESGGSAQDAPDAQQSREPQP